MGEKTQLARLPNFFNYLKEPHNFYILTRHRSGGETHTSSCPCMDVNQLEFRFEPRGQLFTFQGEMVQKNLNPYIEMVRI